MASENSQTKDKATVNDGSTATSSGYAPTTPEGPKPLGRSKVFNSADAIWSVVNAGFNIEKGKYTFLKINPYYFNVVGGVSPSHAQIEALRHVYVTPGEGKVSYRFRLTSTANAFTNGRLLMVHVPPIYTEADLAKLSLFDLSQLNRVEHVIRGGDSILEAPWLLPLPYMPAYDGAANNGYIYLTWVELSQNKDSDPPSLTLWVEAGDIEYAIPRPAKEYVKLSKRMARAEKVSNILSMIEDIRDQPDFKKLPEESKLKELIEGLAKASI